MTVWSIKLYSKLGLTSLMTNAIKGFIKLDPNDYEKLGCIRYS